MEASRCRHPCLIQLEIQLAELCVNSTSVEAVRSCESAQARSGSATADSTRLGVGELFRVLEL